MSTTQLTNDSQTNLKVKLQSFSIDLSSQANIRLSIEPNVSVINRLLTKNPL